MDEIKENSEFYNYYLSVISNNKEEICAKIAFRGKNKTESKRDITFKGTNGEDRTFTFNETSEEDVIFIYNCEIVKEKEVIVDSSFAERVKKVILEADNKKKEQELLYSKSSRPAWQPSLFPNNFDGRTFESFEANDNFKELKQIAKESSHDKVTEGFVSVVLACDIMNEKNILNTLKSLKTKFGANRNDKNEAELIQYLTLISENYLTLYHLYYEDEQNEVFDDTLEEVLDILGEYATGSWIADEVFCLLSDMQDQIEVLKEQKEEVFL